MFSLCLPVLFDVLFQNLKDAALAPSSIITTLVQTDMGKLALLALLIVNRFKSYQGLKIFKTIEKWCK